MKFDALLTIVGAEPVFETGLLLAGDVDPNDVRRQLSRWVSSGRVLQLRRGLYALAPPYARERPHPFVVANRLARPSYVSLQSALAHFGLIPEHVPIVTSVTTARPGRWATPLGTYDFRQVKPASLAGYGPEPLGHGATALVARPEKALLDLVHLVPAGDDLAHLRGLRLQHLDRLDLTRLRSAAVASGSPKLIRAAQHITRIAAEEAEELVAL